MDVIDVNRKILIENKQLEVVEDVIVPDIKPDVVSIVGVNGIAYSYKQEKTNGKIKLDGNIDGYIIYLSSNGDTRSIQTTLNFTNTLENNLIKETSTFKYNIEIINIEAKVLNERKISITANLHIEYNLYEKQSLEIFNDFDNIEDLQKQEEEININSLIGINTVKTTLKENIAIDGLDNIAEILKVKINMTDAESKISYNKVLAKSEANISVMYLTEDDRVNKAQASFPIMSFIELENVKEDNICKLDYKIQNILFKINNKEEHSVMVQVEFEIMCEAYESKNVKIVSDLYSLKNDVNFDYKEIELDVENKENGYPVKINEKIQIENLKQVMDVEGRVNILKNTITNDMSNVEGELALKIYYETTEKIGLNIKSVNVPFITKMSKSNNIAGKILKNEFDSNGEEVILQLDVELMSDSSLGRKIGMIQNVAVRDNCNEDDYSVVVYFVKPSDTIWKIAKMFKVTMDSIIKINSIDNPNMIYPGDKLYIMK